MPVAPIQEEGRFAAVLSSYSHHFLSNRDPLIDNTCCPIKEGGRFAAVVPNYPKETHLY